VRSVGSQRRVRFVKSFVDAVGSVSCYGCQFEAFENYDEGYIVQGSLCKGNLCVAILHWIGGGNVLAR
jgi:hypothetical protein